MKPDWVLVTMVTLLVLVVGFVLWGAMERTAKSEVCREQGGVYLPESDACVDLRRIIVPKKEAQ